MAFHRIVRKILAWLTLAYFSVIMAVLALLPIALMLALIKYLG